MTHIAIMRLSASSCDFLQCPLEIGSVGAERVGQGEVGGFTQRVQTAWPRLVNSSWLEPGGPFLRF